MQRNCSKFALLIVNFVLLTQFGCMAPKIEFEKVAHDFGEIGPVRTNTTEYKYTNTGFGILNVKYVETCCGVTAKQNRKLLLPGETGSVEVEYLPRKTLGSDNKSFYVISNDKENPRMELTLKANIIAKVAWEPKSFKLLLEGENTKSPKIILTSLDNVPFSITDFKSSFNCLTFDIDSSVKATEFVIEPKVNTENIRENVRGYVHILLTHPDWNKVSIPFDVLTKFTINPPQIMVHNAEPNEPVIKYMAIQSIFGQDFEIESVSSQNNFVKLLRRRKVGYSHQFELEITPPAIEGKKQIFTDVIYVKIKDGEKIEIPCHGLYAIKD